MVVREELAKLGLHFSKVELGEVDVLENISDKLHDELQKALLKWGLELMVDKKSALIKQIKSTVIEWIHSSEETLQIKFSNFLSRRLNRDYRYLSTIFSEVQGVTIGKFIIESKIERVKELLVYEERKLADIAELMYYSSVAHLSAQFKKVTGLTPTHFKQLREK